MKFFSKLLDLDVILDGGIPEGSLVEIYGSSDSGKTSLALWYGKALLEEFPDDIMGWVATETHLHSQNLEWAGIDPGRLVFIRQTPDLLAFDAAISLVEHGCRLVVIDSLACCLGSSISTPLTHVLSYGLPRLLSAVKQYGSLAILTNQERHLPRHQVIYTPGSGPALSRLVNYKIRLTKSSYIYDMAVPVGHRVNLYAVRNGVDPSNWGKTCSVNLYYDSRGFRDRRLKRRDESSNEI